MTKIEYWYDRSTKSWVVQKKDDAGNQIGSADYVYSKAEALKLVDQYNKELKMGKLTEEKISEFLGDVNEGRIDDLGFIQIASTAILVEVAHGKLDLNQLAHEELASRGLDMNGKWVGFPRAAEIHGISKMKKKFMYGIKDV